MIQTNDPSVPKKKDDELPTLIAVNGIFIVVLGLMDFFYSDFAIMPDVVKYLVIGAQIAGIGAYGYSIWQWKNPNRDWVRKLTLALVAAACITVGGYKAYSNENKQVLIDSEKAKQGQVK